jgi:hypothetical protein
VKNTLDVARADFAHLRPTLLEQGGVALNLHAFYNGVENILRRVALELGEGLPGGDDWHARLLRNMTLDIPGLRPPLIGTETRNALEELLRFRHVVRHAYGHDLDWIRVEDLLNRSSNAYDLFVADTMQFVRFLEEMATD